MLQIAWDMWQFRNGYVHNGDGTIATAHHARLNREINEVFEDGFDCLMQRDHHLLLDSSPANAQKYNLITKQNWVDSVRLAQQAFHSLEQQNQAWNIVQYFELT